MISNYTITKPWPPPRPPRPTTITLPRKSYPDEKAKKQLGESKKKQIDSRRLTKQFLATHSKSACLDSAMKNNMSVQKRKSSKSFGPLFYRTWRTQTQIRTLATIIFLNFSFGKYLIMLSAFRKSKRWFRLERLKWVSEAAAGNGAVLALL